MRVAAQPVVDHLVGEQRVEDEAARAQPGRERVGHALGRVRAGLAVGQVQARERDLERDRLGAVVELDLERGDLLLEQPAPGVARGQRLLGEDLLLGLGEQVRAVAARRAQVVAAEVQALGGEQLVGARVVERGPLELEEQELRLDRRRLLLDPLVERAAGGVGGVGREVQAGEGAGAASTISWRAPSSVMASTRPGPSSSLDVAGVALGEDVGALPAPRPASRRCPRRGRSGSRRAGGRGPRRPPGPRDRRRRRCSWRERLAARGYARRPSSMTVR